MIIQVPFKENPDEWHCIHSAIHSVAKHFLGKEYSLDYINALLNPDYKLWVWPVQAVKVLDELGLFVRLFYKGDLFKQHPKYIKLTSKDDYKKAIEYVSLRGLHEKEELSISDLKKLLHNGVILIVLFGSLKRLGKYIVLTGYDENGFYFHETGPKRKIPHRYISNEKFFSLWSRDPVRNCVIAIYGRKFGNGYTRV
ncbi:hypothetical protein DRO91_08895 [Candidatus Heimdallarchaeota archaeon]|nr:MAG: hypothetical protein DRO91_08895 [Candidatus Heimdallarchaeota archaeon]